jgi:parvulin-like peptidyl-prolyl isomerase
MGRMRLIFFLTLLVAVQALAEERPASAPQAKPAVSRYEDLFGDIVLAKGKGIVIKQSQLDEAFVSYKANLAARGETFSEDQRQLKEALLLDRIIVSELLVKHATEADKVKAKELYEKLMTASKKSFSSDEAFNRHLKSLGLTTEQFNKRAMEQAISEAVVEREIRSQVTISDAQVRDFYENGTDAVVKIMQGQLEKVAKDPLSTPDQLASIKSQIDQLRKANLSRLQQPERVHVIHLLRSTRKTDSDEPLPPDKVQVKRQEIDKLLARARRGEDFTKLVKEFSEDHGLKETSGEYTFSREDPFVPEFKAAAFSLATNQISDVVTTTFGYHLIKVLEKIPTKKLEYEKIAADIKEALVGQEVQRMMPGHFEKLKTEAAIQILEPRYKLPGGTVESAAVAKP